MAKTTVKPVETWDLTEMLAALCRIAQEAGDAESVPQVDRKLRIASDLPESDLEGSRP
ncbi:MAG: hypothetical protein ACREVR_00970 [Burkholderiales bacterium]